MSTNDGGPAFPTPRYERGDMYSLGMGLRDYFAAKAMNAFMSGHIAHYGHENYWKPSDMAGEAYAVADAMLAAREAGNEAARAAGVNEPGNADITGRRSGA